MKVAVLSESSADEAAVRMLVDAILQQTTESVAGPPLRTRGWPAVRDVLPNVIKHLHYRTDADALVVVVDTNGSPLRDKPHEEPPAGKGVPRLPLLADIARKVRGGLRPLPNRLPLKVAIGAAAPSVEAWYRCGLDPTATEAAWLRALASGAQAPSWIKELKRAAYETDRYSLPHETECAIEHAHRLAENLALLEEHFPTGFGALADEVRSWASS